MAGSTSGTGDAHHSRTPHITVIGIHGRIPSQSYYIPMTSTACRFRIDSQHVDNEPGGLSWK